MTHAEDRAAALHRRTCDFFQFNDERVFPFLDLKDDEESLISALRGTYLRAYYLLWSLTRLDHLGDFQVIMSISRSLFEIYLDQLHLLKDPGSSDLYQAFANIDKMKRAIKVSRHFGKSPHPELEDRFRHLLNMANDPHNIDACEKSLRDTFGITTDIRQDGAKHFPTHWSKINQIGKRAEINQTAHAFYLTYYAKASWSVHGGSSAISHVDLDGGWNSFAEGHELSTNLMMNITYQTSVVMKLGITVEEIGAFAVQS